mmetsp:Transcript_65413/g.181991  ORF Transcript_65413/g.181991 Transcript_65413/m.181991 type:complete len:331 (-) Transcript_65413:24-1016(-)|eukprot:CAMPEP_0117581808 /NCGR_PEP_ID=MMETSP0784-20121206/66053_1 /TAXON_ID=39447 /ORGANISM="" /LENGTH=330 /DNA_ID=CAMNT_0005382201 /DNA_START=83 /DNA_END=1075 /DNA_ORIENTATION=+
MNGDPRAPATLPYEIRDLPDRGKGIVATRNLSANEEVFQESVLLSVKTFMILGGVVVLRRSKVELAYEGLSDEEKQSYRSLHPMCEGHQVVSHGPLATDVSETSTLRHRASKQDEDGVVDPQAQRQQDGASPSAQQHRQIWDMNGLHYCDDGDVRVNRVLHFALFPFFFSLITGYAWAYYWQGHYLRAVLGAGVFFFAMLGPISMCLIYAGSQALCLQASRVNHSCLPNATWQLDGQRAPLGGHPGGSTAVAESEPIGTFVAPFRLSLRTKRAVAQGEELTIDYIPDLAHLDAAERRNLLKKEYGFLCSCKRCAAPGQKSDAGAEDEEAH